MDGRSEKIDTFCGGQVPLPLMSSGPRLSLEFKGLTSSRYVRGFKALYSFTESEYLQSRRALPLSFVRKHVGAFFPL
jgi:hypothetical protein